MRYRVWSAPVTSQAIEVDIAFTGVPVSELVTVLDPDGNSVATVEVPSQR